MRLDRAGIIIFIFNRRRHLVLLNRGVRGREWEKWSKPRHKQRLCLIPQTCKTGQLACMDEAEAEAPCVRIVGGAS